MTRDATGQTRRVTRPNILLIMADQLAAPFLSIHGGPAITPNIERLAARGVTFTSAYSNSPLCAPARFAMMSGQLNSKIGAYDNASEFAASIPTFAHHLRAAGYQTSLVGKMHFVGPDQLHGFEERLTTDIYPADFGWTPNWDDPDGRFDWWFHNMDSVVHAGVVDVSNQLDYDDDVGHFAIRKLRDLARSDDDRPWMMVASFTHPHDPYAARQEFWDRYDHESVPLPTVDAIPADRDDPHSQRLRHVIAADVTPVDDEQIRTARHAYLANISYVDDHLGRMLDVLDHHGMADDTVVIFTSDHGDMLGERGLWYKMSFFEHACRIPMIVKMPDGAAAGSTNDSHVGLLDVAPTLLDLGGVDVPVEMDGTSMLPLLGGPEERTVLGEYLGEGAVAPIFMIRRGRWKFVWSSADGAQLFDLDADPHELTNLADDSDDSDHAEIVAAFSDAVAERWDPPAIDAAVRANQRARAVVDAAMRRGRFAAWDYQPTTDAANQYMRNHLDLNEVESGRRA